MDESFDPEAHAEAMALWIEASAMVDQPVVMEIVEEPASSPAAAAAPAALLRTDSM